MQKNKHLTNRQGVKFDQLGRQNNVSRAKMKEFFSQFKLRNLQNLKSEKIISIPKMSFNPGEFFIHRRNDNGIQLWLSDDIQNIFLPLLSKNIEFDGVDLEKLRLKKRLSDFDIQKKIGNQIQNPDDIAAEIKYLISQQPKGKKNGDLDVPYISHIFYFEYMGRVWSVWLRWGDDGEEWDMDCDETNAFEWNVGDAVFSPATDKS